ncbi:MAG: peptidoglycan DD-metalloendopeptidase family protein [Bacteroidota bacterium]|nr:peptidoglycan DD-metalloendopeptidase family protein [Bacteroidota bacterium]
MILAENNLYEFLKIHTHEFHPVVKFNSDTDTLSAFDFTENNHEFKKIDRQNTQTFSKYIFDKLKMQGAKFGYGGYDELRALYNESDLFNQDLNNNNFSVTPEEPRRLHIGIDIWGKAGTEIFAPTDGHVHSFAFNDHFGDYGATIILFHQSEGISFHTLYGHVSLEDIKNLREGEFISRGKNFASFGKPAENGHWPPHLHFQIIKDILPYKGDYPGVCKLSERIKYLENCPDPEVILNMARFKNV